NTKAQTSPSPPLLVIWVMTWLSWRNTFVFFGGLGLVWAFVFYRSFRDNPREHPKINDAELELIGGRGLRTPPREANPAGFGDPALHQAKVPWRDILRSRSIWLLWTQYFCLTYGWYFYVTWLP